MLWLMLLPYMNIVADVYAIVDNIGNVMFLPYVMADVIAIYEYMNIYTYNIQITSEYGKENVKIFQQWEKMEYKMADFSNHRRFSLRCLSEGLIPVSVRLKVI